MAVHSVNAVDVELRLLRSLLQLELRRGEHNPAVVSIRRDMDRWLEIRSGLAAAEARARA
jgi:hypothetical protein